MQCSTHCCSGPACGAGLDLDSDVIIEIAVIITDGSLQHRIMVNLF